MLEVAQFVKLNHNVFTVIGGVHVTINPEEHYLNYFDALCIGEGEYALAELVDKLEKGEEIEKIENLWVKQNGKICKNRTRPFIQDLDILPFVDRDIWQPLIFESQSRISVLLGRGCPYNCTYCCNHKIKQVASGKYVRMRSVEHIISEIKYLTTKFPLNREYFLEVETLGVDIDWVLNLCHELFLLNESREHKLSFGTNLRVYDKLDVDLIFKNLKKANFKSVTIGLESGNERIRKEVLNRYYSNESITKAVKTAQKYKIEVGLFNLIGLPTETLDDFKDTLKLNQDLQPNWHATSIFFHTKVPGYMIWQRNRDFCPTSWNLKRKGNMLCWICQDFPKNKFKNNLIAFIITCTKKVQIGPQLRACSFIAKYFWGIILWQTQKTG